MPKKKEQKGTADKNWQVIDKPIINNPVTDKDKSIVDKSFVDKHAAKKKEKRKMHKKIISAKAKVISTEQKRYELPTPQQQTAHDPYFMHKVILLVAIAALLVFNQMQIGTVSALAAVAVPMSMLNSNSGSSTIFSFLGGDYSLDDVDVTQIESTAQGIAVLFPVKDIQTQADAIAMLVPTGTPEYGKEMGVTFDDPITSMNKLSGAYPTLKQMAKEDSAVWERYLSLAAAPRGIACEFCCGVGPQGVTASGDLRCGCAHNPAVQSVTLWLMLNTDYTDAEILREVYLWKGLWFPRNMVTLSLQIAGGDTSVLQDLPGMVGGC